VRDSSLELRIEELVLRGFAPEDRYRIAEAVEGELTRLFTKGGLPAWMHHGGDLAYLGGITFEAAPDAGARDIGVHLARSLYGGLQR
jgi:hypothetical protein